MSGDFTIKMSATEQLKYELDVRLAPAWHVSCFDVVDSTNSYLLTQAEQKSIHKHLCVAEQQTMGRGRQGKAWFDNGRALLFSFGWRAASLDASVAMVSGLALIEVLHDAGFGELSLKWPNDILIAGKKLAGILVESARGHYVIGVGINLAPLDEDDITAGYLPNGQDIDRANLLINLLCRQASLLQQWQEQGMAPFIARWNRWHYFQDKTVRIFDQNSECRGQVVSVHATGVIELLTDRGLRQFDFGRVSLRGD